MKRNSANELDRLYALIPKMKECKGYCQDSCTVIPATIMEKTRIEKAAGKELRLVPHPLWSMRCSMLTGDGRCSQHAIRPLICRAYGAVDTPMLICNHGCEPERWLTLSEFEEISDAVQRLGGEMVVQAPEYKHVARPPNDDPAAGIRSFLDS